MRLTRISTAAETTFMVVALAFFMGAVASLLFLHDGTLTDEAKESLRAINVPFYIGTAMFFVPRARPAAVIRDLKACWPVVAMILLAFLSSAWSIAPEITLRRCAALVFTMLFSLYVADRYNLAALLQLLALACGGILVLSIAFVVLFPSLGISPLDGSWRGVFPNKNTFGRDLLIAIVVLALTDPGSSLLQALRRIGIVLSAICLWLSLSRGPLITLVLLAPLALLGRGFRLSVHARTTVGLIVVTVSFIAAAGAYLYLPNVLGVLGRDETLTGRTELWPLVEAAIRERPWLGYGFGAFWDATTGPNRTIWETIEWDAPSAHNGYLDLWLGMGILGPVGLLISMLLNLRNARRAMRRGYLLEAKWCVLLMVSLGIANSSESEFMEQNNIMMILYVVTTIYTMRAAGRSQWPVKRARRQQPAPVATTPEASWT